MKLISFDTTDPKSQMGDLRARLMAANERADRLTRRLAEAEDRWARHVAWVDGDAAVRKLLAAQAKTINANHRLTVATLEAKIDELRRCRHGAGCRECYDDANRGGPRPGEPI